MKHILLLLLATSAINVFAVPSNTKPATQHEAMYNAILQKQSASNSANKTTGIQRRLVANSYTLNGVLTDTNHYYYSYGRGSTHSDVTSYFDEYYITAIDPVHTILCDSSTNSHLYSGQWYKTGTRSYTYDANNRITKMLSQSYSYITSYMPSYNSAGKFEVITMADTMATMPASTPKSRMYIFYDSQNRRTMDSTVDLKTNTPSGKRVYVYSANGNRLQFNSYQYTGGNWDLTYRNINWYDTANRLIISTAEIDFGMGNGLEKSNKDSFAYIGSNTKPCYHKDFNWDDVLGEWVADEIILSQYNAANLLDTYYIIRYTTQWDTIERDAYTYDANNLMLRSNGYLYTGNGSFSTTPYDQTIMYYENYFPTAVSNINTAKNTLEIYPNPANESVVIKTDYSDSYCIQITDLLGKTVYTESNIHELQKSIGVTAFAPGSYIIQIKGNTGATIAQRQFIKD
jgi:hypothetical protein